MSKRRYSEAGMFSTALSSRKGGALATRSYVKKCMKSALATKEITVTGIVGNGGLPTTTGRVDPIGTFNILEGTSDDDREGNWITRDSVTLRLSCAKPAADVSGTYFRIVLVKDNQTNGATPAIADILSYGTGALGSGFNGDNVQGFGGKRFTILKDTFFVLNSAASGATGESLTYNKAWTWKIKGGGQVHFDSTAGGIGDIVSGEIFLVTATSSATSSVACTQQTKYHDG